VVRRKCLIWYIESVPWRLETLNATVDAELDALPVDMRARSIRIAELIESVGLPQVREPHGKHLQGPLWAIRLSGRAGIARALYVTMRQQRVIVVRAFVKKTLKTPPGEIARALTRLNDERP